MNKLNNLMLKIICFCSILLPISLYASSDSSLNISKYFNASCASYTGTWSGFFTDPTDLFGNGGPWPVKLTLYNKDDKLFGTVISKNLPSYVSNAMKGNFWALCKKGQLSKIFVGQSNQCGSYSNQGMLVSKNVLVLEINYQNAMNSAPFLLFLKRSNNKFQGKTPNQILIPKIKTCH